MLIKIQHITPLQYFCEFVTNSKVIFISIKGPDDHTCHEGMKGLSGARDGFKSNHRNSQVCTFTDNQP